MRPALRWLCRRWRADERGSATAELVIATPVLLLLILLVVQFALWQHSIHVAQAAASEGLAAARVQGGTAGSGQDEANLVLAQLSHSVLVHPLVQVAKGANTTTVTVSGEAEAVIPFLHLPVRATASGPVERFRPPGQSP
jgi:Flp pilus assembly protein TadG